MLCCAQKQCSRGLTRHCLLLHRNASGYSPLHLACHNQDNYNFEIVKDIVRNGYNTNVNLVTAEPFCASHHHQISGTVRSRHLYAREYCSGPTCKEQTDFNFCSIVWTWYEMRKLSSGSVSISSFVPRVFRVINHVVWFPGQFSKSESGICNEQSLVCLQERLLCTTPASKTRLCTRGGQNSPPSSSLTVQTSTCARTDMRRRCSASSCVGNCPRTFSTCLVRLLEFEFLRTDHFQFTVPSRV